MSEQIKIPSEAVADVLMTDKQKELSDKRAEIYKKYEDEGVVPELVSKCNLNYSAGEPNFELVRIGRDEITNHLSGMIDGHKVFLGDHTDSLGKSHSYSGSVDDEKVDESVAEKLWKKYEPIARAQEEIREQLDDRHGEVTVEHLLAL